MNGYVAIAWTQIKRLNLCGLWVFNRHSALPKTGFIFWLILVAHWRYILNARCSVYIGSFALHSKHLVKVCIFFQCIIYNCQCLRLCVLIFICLFETNLLYTLLHTYFAHYYYYIIIIIVLYASCVLAWWFLHWGSIRISDPVFIPYKTRAMLTMSPFCQPRFGKDIL